METTTHKEKRKGDHARSTMYTACTKFLQKCGGQATNPLLFATLAEVAAKDFSLKFDGPVQLDDVCFVRVQNSRENLVLAKREKRGDKRKKKYELPDSENVVASLSKDELSAEKDHVAEG